MNLIVAILAGSALGVAIYFIIRPVYVYALEKGKSIGQLKTIGLGLYVLTVIFGGILSLLFAVTKFPNIQNYEMNSAILACLLFFVLPFGRMLYRNSNSQKSA